MKVNQSPRVGVKDPNLQRELRDHAIQINALSEGRMVATYNATTAAPTDGQYAIGDFVKNSAPSELGSSSSKYVILGFLCVASGTPGTFVEVRCLTGN